MGAREQEYRWYVTGCNRLGQAPLDEAAFAARWQELEDHAEKLKPQTPPKRWRIWMHGNGLKWKTK